MEALRRYDCGLLHRSHSRQPKASPGLIVFVYTIVFQLDVMHLLDCKGVAAIAFGSLLCYMVTLPSLGPRVVDRLSRINRERLKWIRAHPGEIHLPVIKESNLRKDGWGDLHGPAFKSTITRHAAGFFKHLSNKFLILQTPEEQSMTRVLNNLYELYGMLWNSPRFLLQNDLDELQRVCIQFGEDWMRCREFARLRNALLFNVTGKVHKTQHIPAMAAIINPAWVSCYAEESLIGTTMKVWKQSQKGRWKRLIQKRVLLKRLCGLVLRLEGNCTDS